MKLSVIIPALNESDHIEFCLASIRTQFDGEVIVVDGGSTDETRELATPLATRVMTATSGMAHQCNVGAELASGDVLLFISADCQMLDGWLGDIESAMRSPYCVGGGFKLLIDDWRLEFKILSFGGNFRSRYLGLALGDQCCFVRRVDFLAVGGMKIDSLIPHAKLCHSLKQRGEFRLLPRPVMSSPRKWRQKGVFSTTMHHMWSYMKFHYRELPHNY